MKKTGILNSEISAIVASMGHGDFIVLSDMGLPVPNGVRKIDLVVDRGKPNLIDVLRVILRELKVERVIFAREILDKSRNVYDEVMKVLGDDVKVDFISHEEFKMRTSKAKAVIRTGEDKPYANVILISGVIF